MLSLAILNSAIYTHRFPSCDQQTCTKNPTRERKHKKNKNQYSKIHNGIKKVSSPNRFSLRGRSQEKYNNNHTTGIVNRSC